MKFSKLFSPLIKLTLFSPLIFMNAFAGTYCTKDNICHVSITNNSTYTFKLSADTWSPCVNPRETSGLEYVIKPGDVIDWKIWANSTCSPNDIKLSARFSYGVTEANEVLSCIFNATLDKTNDQRTQGFVLTSSGVTCSDPSVSVTGGNNTFVLSGTKPTS